MNRPTMLFKALLAQASMELEVSTERDFEEIRSRFEHEGLSFLTITLPVLSDALEAGLEYGRLTPPAGFKRVRRGGTLPAFLQGLFRRVFDEGGILLDEPCCRTIYWIRQIARFFKKPKLSCSPRREALAVSKFKQVEEDLYHATRDVNRFDKELDVVSAILWSSVFPTLDSNRVVCGHGPGATADRLLPNGRRNIRYWYTRAEGSLSAADHAFHNWNACFGEEGVGGIRDIDYRDIRQEPGVRVVFVPKTLQSPRVIAIEPSVMQFMQQGIARHMVATLESHRLTKGSVNFTDQSINQTLAYKASIDRRLATIDLSDASDRVHLELVQRIFRRSGILEFLEDCRSLHADLPDGSNILLKKYASMGSALCFPVEACVFYTLVVTAILKKTGKLPNYRSLERLKKSVKVYGDDIICPSEHVDAVSDYLESYGLRVNRRKSFSRSLFRESCGADYFNGYSVKPIYARMDLPARKSEWTPNHYMSWVSTANQFYRTGSWIVAQAIRDMVSSTIGKHIPITRDESRGLSYASYFQERNLRFNVATFSWEQSRIEYHPIKRKDLLNGTYGCYNLAFEGVSREGLTGDGLWPSTEAHYRWESMVALYESDDLDPTEVGRLDRLDPRTGRSLLPTSSMAAFPVNGEAEIADMGEGSPASETGLDDGFNRQPLRRSDSRGVANVSISNRKILQYSGKFLFRNAPGDGGSRDFDHTLDEVSRKLDFHSTVRRGAFTSKRRWITIVS